MRVSFTGARADRSRMVEPFRWVLCQAEWSDRVRGRVVGLDAKIGGERFMTTQLDTMITSGVIPKESDVDAPASFSQGGG